MSEDYRALWKASANVIRNKSREIISLKDALHCPTLAGSRGRKGKPMSIDGFIEKVTRDEPFGAILIELAGRKDRGTGYTPAGQSKLRIVQPTWTPEVGMVIWGSASSVTIEAEPKREYTRWGYTRLIEKGREEEARSIGYPHEEICPKCQQSYQDDVTGEYPCERCGMPTVHDAAP